MKAAIAELLAKANRAGVYTGICGQAPSDHPEFAQFLVRHGIGSISVSPDSFLQVKQQICEAERQKDQGKQQMKMFTFDVKSWVCKNVRVAGR